MRKVYVSFLGTNDYVECFYEPKGGETDRLKRPVRFVQEATVFYCCQDWGVDDRIVIFTTKDALEKNWKDDGHLDRATGKPWKRSGLETCLRELSLAVPFDNVLIPDGHSEEEIWEIFDRVSQCIESGDEVVFDITHAFRSIPLLTIVVLNYLKVLKKVALKGIYYGAFEVLGSIQDVMKKPIEERIVPIMDFTPLDRLMDWTVATDRFLATGDASMAGALARSGVEGILRETRGKDRSAASIRNLGASLESFSRMLFTCRGKQISETALELKAKVHDSRGLELQLPFRPLFDMIEDKLNSFTGDQVADGLAAVRWCADHNLVQQGYTILEEILFSYTVSGVGMDPLNVPLREIASQAYAIMSRKIEDAPKEWHSPAREDPDATRMMISFIKQNSGLSGVVERLRVKRNDLNHAGFIDANMGVRNSHRFSEELIKLLREMEDLIKGSSTATRTARL